MPPNSTGAPANCRGVLSAFMPPESSSLQNPGQTEAREEQIHQPSPTVSLSGRSRSRRVMSMSMGIDQPAQAGEGRRPVGQAPLDLAAAAKLSTPVELQ